MKRLLLILATVIFWPGLGSLFAAITPEQAKSLPPPAKGKVDFGREIKPIFEASCIKCHGRGRIKGGLSIETRETLLKGGDSGPAIVPGKSGQSHLIELVAGLDPDSVMPQKGKRLTPEQVGLLRAWIDEGAPWDARISFARPAPLNLSPRKPDLPSAGKGLTNPIDRLLAGYFRAHNVKPGQPVDDRVYARRVFLDAIGLPPSPQELEAFLGDAGADKRERLVARLLSDNRRYAEHWLSFWNDALRNDYRGTGYIDGGRKQITGWLYSALATNMPFDQFVRELISPVPESEGFTRGIVWRGVVNASQTPQMQAAQNISQVFLGVNLKCASCHDSFINDWTLADSYGLAAAFSDTPLEMVHCDKPTGQFATVKFLYPELGGIDPKADRAARMKQLAALITSRNDGRLTRTIVNRFWEKFFGRGLIEPADDMEHPAFDQDLLDWLAADLADNGYNLKRTIGLILTSRAYQLPAGAATEQAAGEYVFRGPVVRRLSGEQFLDALSSVTGVWRDQPAAQVDFAVADPSLAATAVEAQWIWKDVGAAERAEAQTVHWRKVIELAAAPAEAVAVVACDNSFKLFVNGKEAGSGNDYTQARVIDLKPHLTAGKNLIAVEAVNGPGKPDEPSADQSNPAGLIVYARIRGAAPAGAKTGGAVMDVATDNSWLWSVAGPDGWNKPGFDANDWRPAVALGPVDRAPWHLGEKWAAGLSSVALRGEVRAALVNSDPLMTALGRPNREQVVTSRASAATTLQALELTNGATLAGLLHRGAGRLAKEAPGTAGDLVVMLYERGLARRPTAQELRLSEEIVGAPVREEGVEDLLWAMTMLPEFQLIY